ncbi:MAG TPA: MFS transporter [Streptosporangiaceae bacterium]|nr:MFS transporter [Streptosporangiaceae bacterium]
MDETADARLHGGLWRRFGSTFEVLSITDLRRLWTGQLVSLIGDQLFLVAIPFVLLTGRHNADQLGVVLLCLGVGRTITMVIGGSLSDRFERRLVMMASDVARLLLTALLAVIVLTASRPTAEIAVLAGLLGLAQGLFLPSSFAIVPDLVDEDRVVAANSVISLQVNLATLVGPAIGGALVAGTSPGVALLADAATFGVSAWTLALIRGKAGVRQGNRTPASDTGSVGDTGTGDTRSYRSFLRFATSSRLLLFSVLVTFVVNLGYTGMVQIGLPALARERFAHAPVAYGLMLAGSGIGAIAGSISAGRVLARARPALLALGAGITEGLSILLVPTLPGLAGCVLALVLVGVVSSIVNVFFVSAMQGAVPRQYLGRAMSLLIFSAAVTSPISYGVVGWVVTVSGPATAIFLAGVATVAAFSIGFASRDIRQLTLS